MTHLRDRLGRLKRFTPLLVIVLAAVVLVSVIMLPEPDKTPPRAEELVVPVEVLVVTTEPVVIDSYVQLGTIEPQRVVTVAVEVPGRVERISVREGQVVVAGQELIGLNTDLLQAALDQAAAQAEFQAHELELVMQAQARGAATPFEVEAARSRARATAAAMETARQRLIRSTVLAPIDGVVNRLPVEFGEYLAEGAPVAQIVDLSSLKVALDVPERDIRFVRMNQPVDLYPGGLVNGFQVEGPEQRGHVSYVSEVADPRTRTFRVEVTVAAEPAGGQPAGRGLRSGQMVRARMVRQEFHDVILVPLRMIVPLERGRAVYVVGQDSRVEMRRVELGLLTGDRAMLVDHAQGAGANSQAAGAGLQPGDRLITVPQAVAPGQLVRIVAEGTLGPPGSPTPTDDDSAAPRAATAEGGA